MVEESSCRGREFEALEFDVNSRKVESDYREGAKYRENIGNPDYLENLICSLGRKGAKMREEGRMMGH
jgi:hypothetical protein